MKSMNQNKDFLIHCAKTAGYRVVAEQITLATRAGIVAALLSIDSKYAENAEKIVSSDFGKALVQFGVSMVLHQLPVDNPHVQALTYECMVSSIATGEGAILTAAFSGVQDFVKNKILSIKDESFAKVQESLSESVEEEIVQHAKSVSL